MIQEDENTLLGIEREQIAYMTVAILLPLFVAPTALYASKDATTATIVYTFVCLMTVPAFYITCLTKAKRPLTYFLTGEIRPRKSQLLWSLFVGVVIFAFHFTIIYFISTVLDAKEIRVPLNKSNTLNTGVFFSIFILILPPAEEWFWRIFVSKSLPNRWWATCLNSLVYGILYFLIIFFIFPRMYSILAGIYSIFVGVCLIYARRMFRFLGVTIIHLMMNLGVMAGFFTFYYKYMGEYKSL